MNHARRKSFVLLACVLLTLVGAWAASRTSAPRPIEDQNTLTANRFRSHSTRVSLAQPLTQPQTGTPFELSHNVIAGGGGTSSGNVAGTPIKLDGTIGQAATGTISTSSNGQYSVTGGFWQAEATPTPTPTQIPGPTIFVEEGVPNRAVALDSVTFVRGPLRVLTNHNFSADGHTRVILFTSDLGLSQPDPAVLTVQAAGFPLTVENVGAVTGVTGLNASYIVVRLPDGLPAGDLPLLITLRGVSSSNSPTISISP